MDKEGQLFAILYRRFLWMAPFGLFTY